MRNYKIKTYAKKKLSYSQLLALNPKNSFAGKEMKVSQMTYEEVKVVVRDLGKKFTWQVMKDVFETCYGISEKQFWNGRVVEFFSAMRFIQSEFSRLAKTEQKLLKNIASVDAELWKQAEKGRLNRFAPVLPLVQLGKIYSQYPFDLKDKPYLEILHLLTIQKETTEVDREYNKLKKMVQ